MANFNEQRERDYQNKLVKRFQEELGYAYLGNWQYAKGAECREDGKKNSPILEDRLTAFLQKKGYTNYQINRVLGDLKTAARLSNWKMQALQECNNALYQTLIFGIQAAPTPDPDDKNQTVKFFDFENVAENDFAIAEEVSYIDTFTGANKRPDIVVYINGIAIAVIELKRSIVSISEGVKQHLSNQRDFIPSFFTTTQFAIASNDGVDFQYATIGTPEKFWCKWKKDTTETGVVLTEQESYAQFFDKENLLFFLHYGVLNDGGIKKVLRPHQLYAIKAAAKRMPKKASGVIWHSQGSGKSLTMVSLANYIRKNFENPRVIVITDRKELDKQLFATFSNTGETNLHRAKSGEDLLRTLNNGKEWMVSTLIHKFGTHRNSEDDIRDEKSGTKIRLDKYLDELRAIIAKDFNGNFSVSGNNIFVFIDECHRTQGGLLHQAMREIMGKEVMLIGFTGTPLLKSDKDKQYNDFVKLSEVTFGPFIHKYLHKQAVEDGVILDLQYEYRNVEQEISDQDKLDEKFEKLVKGRELNDEKTEQVKERWATLERVYSTKERIGRIGYSIIDDYQFGLLQHSWCNAMLVAGSIYQAYRYYDFFENNDSPLKGHTAVVTSYNPNPQDIANDLSDTDSESEKKYKYDQAKKSFENAGVTDMEAYEEKVKKQFINQPGQMKLLIVVNKLLTGFDAPCATILYLDNDLKDHNLFQAICRVNRLGTDIKDENGELIAKTHKEFGLIVDFKNLFNSIEDAITRFNDDDGGFGGLDNSDIEGLLNDAIAKNLGRLKAANDAYLSLKSEWLFKDLNNNEKLAEYYCTDYENNPAKPRREAMYAITGALVNAFNNMSSYFAKTNLGEEQIAEYERNSKEAGIINRKVKQKSGDDFDARLLDPDMRRLLDQYIRADEADTLIKADADFSFLDMITEANDVEEETDKIIKELGGNEEGAAEIIEGKARSVNNDCNSTDEASYLLFSERLQQLLNKLKEEKANARERIKALIDYIKKVKKGIDTPDNLPQSKRCKALWNNRKKWCSLENESEIVELIKQIDDFITNNAQLDWKTPYHNDAVFLIEDLQSEFHFDEEQTMNIYLLAIQNS